MTWCTLNDGRYRHAMNEIPKQRDRGAGIIATSILEDHLTVAIKSRLDRDDDVESKLFKGNGPLASLSAKIDIGLLLGLYPKKVYSRLHEIRELRNDFAHNPLPVSFRSQRARCKRLAFPVGFRKEWNKFLNTALRSAELLEAPVANVADVRFNTTMFQSSRDPRVQFIRAVQAITMLLTFDIIYSRMTHDWEKTWDRAPRPTLHKTP